MAICIFYVSESVVLKGYHDMLLPTFSFCVVCLFIWIANLIWFCGFILLGCCGDLILSHDACDCLCCHNSVLWCVVFKGWI